MTADAVALAQDLRAAITENNVDKVKLLLADSSVDVHYKNRGTTESTQRCLFFFSPSGLDVGARVGARGAKEQRGRQANGETYFPRAFQAGRRPRRPDYRHRSESSSHAPRRDGPLPWSQ